MRIDFLTTWPGFPTYLESDLNGGTTPTRSSSTISGQRAFYGNSSPSQAPKQALMIEIKRDKALAVFTSPFPYSVTCGLYESDARNFSKRQPRRVLLGYRRVQYVGPFPYIFHGDAIC